MQRLGGQTMLKSATRGLTTSSVMVCKPVMPAAKVEPKPIEGNEIVQPLVITK